MKYVTVRDYLVELIDTRLSVGDVVPSERELAEFRYLAHDGSSGR